MRTLSWDGRIVVTAESGGWSLRVFRPENATVNAAGVPDLSNGIRSDEYHVENNFEGGMGEHNNLGLFPAPGSPLVNPFRSNGDGAQDPNGAFECYEVMVVTTYYATPGAKDETGQRRLRIVVREPKTKNARIEKAEFLESFKRYTTVSGQPVNGIEPTVSFDGRLIVYQGHPKNNGEIDILMYTWNANPGTTTGWSTPRSIADMYHVDRDTMVAGIKFSERYPMAAQPLRTPDGATFAKSSLFHGAYPWLTHDGTELFFCAALAGVDGVDRARRGASSVIGRWTGYMLRHIDGPVNIDREKSVRFSVQGPGAAPSFWHPFPESKGVPFPYTAARPVFPVVGSSTDDYNCLDFEDHEDKDYVLALRMNESITIDGKYDPSRTPDTSGNFNIGILEGARSPIEYDGQDGLRGVVGQAIHFAESDKVRVKSSASLNDARKKLTVEMWVKRTIDLNQDGDNRFRFLANRPGAWTVILEETGQVQVGVTVGKQDRRSGAPGPALAMNDWSHFAFTYDAASGVMKNYVNGELVGTQTFPPGDIDSTTADLLIGNAGQTSPAPFVGARDAIFLIDDLRVSRVVRSEEEIARAAYRDLPKPSFPYTVGLPQGLDPRQLRIPAPVSNEAAELGKLLFFDDRLSVDRSISCSTCHEPSKAFTDGRRTAVGLKGKTLERNSQTVINRSLSTAQFWDGRVGSLEEQALAPIENPDEMGNTIAEVLRFLDASPEYTDKFKRAFGSGPSRDGIGRALAAFQRTINSGASAVDRYNGGDKGALSDSERNGHDLFQTKARCVACHNGSNFTDESFHATAQTTLTDLGRGKITERRRDRSRFKTPTLRDISETGHYLHDGAAPSLDDLVVRYDRGSVGQADRDSEIRPLGLSAGEKGDLVAFLRALRGTSVNVNPPSLPPDPPGWTPPSTPAPPPPPPPPAPGNGRRFEAENYTTAFDQTTGNAGGAHRAGDVDIGAAMDAGGGFTVGWIDDGEWLAFSVGNVAGTTAIDFRVAAAAAPGTSPGTIEVRANDASGPLLGSVAVPGTGDWQVWTTARATIQNPGAATTLVLVFRGAGASLFNVNWLELVGGAGGMPAPPAGGGTDLVNGGFDQDASGWTIVGGAWVPQEPSRSNPRRGIAHIHPQSKTLGSWVEQEVTLVDARAVRATVSDFRRDAGNKSDVVFVLRVKNAAGAWRDHVTRTVNYDEGWVDLRADLSVYKGQTVTIRVEARAGGKQQWASEHAAVDKVTLEAP
ncbi:MAG: cytochrome c peroxidase, partial [Planctomycetota bacterium]